MRLRDMPVVVKLTGALIVPVAVLMVMGWSEMQASWVRYHHMYNLRDATNEIEIVAALIQSLQTERGTTAGLIGSRGARMSEAMGKARKATDEAHEPFEHAETLLEQIGDQYAKPLMGRIEPMIHEGLEGTRASVDSFTANGGEVFAFYTRLIHELTLLAISLHHAVDEPKIAGPLSDFTLLLAAKEFAAQERGIGTAVIASGRFTPEQFFAFAEIGGKEAALFNLYLDGVPAAIAESARSRILPLRGAVAELRHSLTQDGFSRDLTPYEPDEWFAIATRQIDMMRTLADETIHRIEAVAVKLGDEAFESFVWLLGIAAATALVLIAATLFLSRSITVPLRSLTAGLNALLQGRTDMTGVDTSRGDEFGTMARTVRDIIVQTEERVRREREEEAERQAEDQRRRAAVEAERAKTQAASMQAVDELGKALSRLSEGDLTYRIETRFAEVFEPLRHNFNRSLAALEEAVAVVADVSGSLQNNSSELRVAANDLARRSEQQAAALEETAAALGEVSDTVEESARRAERAGGIVSRTANETRRSNDVVKSTIAAIQAIATSSQEVTRFVGVIDEIAFQTNLLALNAGVEAARAGEAGKGFAVVAQEVRELAQRSADAARQIKEIVTRSVGEVETGVSMSRQTGEALGGILGEVSSLKDEMDAIVSSAHAQATALSEVSHAIAQMDQTTQQNAAMVEQSTAATNNLAEQSMLLDEKVSGFTLGRKAQGKGEVVPLRGAA
ncbi:methyl-accepting chemotaxis protein [Jiella endophytica]|uniref:Methyl-accepting chemotaxis protein n=1 Tax=Jiella endophytica TaxID=2558362 RepID=A0A4Y8RMG7_9HYPH|nr:methyl-accepting chemotaxis protein [Jiella endophytica]TFF24843.1 methyl-accepting chemotaxis protein [Jiella endophytica]